MKKWIFMVVALLTFTAAHATTSATKSTTSTQPVSSDAKKMANKTKMHPCAPVFKACKDAGYAPGKHKEGKGIEKDCIDPILSGGAAPAGVDVSKLTITQECRDHHATKEAEHKEKKEERKKLKEENKQNSTTTPTP